MVRFLGACLRLCVRVCAYCFNVCAASVCELLRDVVGLISVSVVLCLCVCFATRALMRVCVCFVCIFV